MNLNISPIVETPAPMEHEASTAKRREAETNSVTTPTPGQAADNPEPSPSERLYEAYRLWAFTGR